MATVLIAGGGAGGGAGDGEGGELAGGVLSREGRESYSGLGDAGQSGELTLLRAGDTGSRALKRGRLRGPCGVMLGRRRRAVAEAREGSSGSSAMQRLTRSTY